VANNTVDLFAVNLHAAFHINGNINSYTLFISCYIDTEAAVSLLDAKTWDTIRGYSTLEPWSNPGLMGVEGTSLNMLSRWYIVADLRTEDIYLDLISLPIYVPYETMELRGNEQPILLHRITNMQDHKHDNMRVVLANDLSI